MSKIKTAYYACVAYLHDAETVTACNRRIVLLDAVFELWNWLEPEEK